MDAKQKHGGGMALRIQLRAINGGELYVCNTNPFPNSSEYTWRAEKGGIGSVLIGYNPMTDETKVIEGSGVKQGLRNRRGSTTVRRHSAFGAAIKQHAVDFEKLEDGDYYICVTSLPEKAKFELKIDLVYSFS